MKLAKIILYLLIIISPILGLPIIDNIPVIGYIIPGLFLSVGSTLLVLIIVGVPTFLIILNIYQLFSGNKKRKLILSIQLILLMFLPFWVFINQGELHMGDMLLLFTPIYMGLFLCLFFVLLEDKQDNIK